MFTPSFCFPSPQQAPAFQFPFCSLQASPGVQEQEATRGVQAQSPLPCWHHQCCPSSRGVPQSGCKDGRLQPSAPEGVSSPRLASYLCSGNVKPLRWGWGTRVQREPTKPRCSPWARTLSFFPRKGGLGQHGGCAFLGLYWPLEDRRCLHKQRVA